MSGPSVPPVGCEDAVDLVNQLYGLKVLECTPLRSYADRNFLVTIENVEEGSSGKEERRVLKVLNKRQSKSTVYTDAQNEYLLHLRNNGINCPMLFSNLDGNFSTLKRLPENAKASDSYNIRLFSYIPGRDMYDMDGRPSEDLLRQVGKLLANICNADEVFEHEGYKENESIFVPERLPTLAGYISHIPGEENRDLVTEVMDDYKEKVVPALAKLTPRPIHGDISPSNIIITRGPDEQDFRVVGIIDIFDTMKSHIVFEIAICLGLMMLKFGETEEDCLEMVSGVMVGFLSVRKLATVERNLLKICTESCLARLVVCGAYFVAAGRCDPDEVEKSTDCFCLRKLRQISSAAFLDALKQVKW